MLKDIVYSDIIQTVDNSIEIIHNNIIQVKDDGNSISDPVFSTSNDNNLNENADNDFKFQLSPPDTDNTDLEITSVDPSTDPTDPSTNPNIGDIKDTVTKDIRDPSDIIKYLHHGSTLFDGKYFQSCLMTKHNILIGTNQFLAYHCKIWLIPEPYPLSSDPVNFWRECKISHHNP